MDGSRKRPGGDGPGGAEAKRQKTEGVLAWEDDILPGLPFEGDLEELTLEDMMEMFGGNATCPAAENLHSLSLPVTINGNEETCGPSFADSKSTVLADDDVDVDNSGVGVPCVIDPVEQPSGEATGSPETVDGPLAPEEPKAEEVPVQVQETKSCGDDWINEEWFAWIVNANSLEFQGKT